MRTRFTPRDRSSDGHALLMVMCITVAMMIMLAATMNRTSGTTAMNARNNQYIVGLYAAEAATEKVFGMMKTDFLAGNLVSITNQMKAYAYQKAIPMASENAYWNQFQFSDGNGNLNSNSVYCTLSAWQVSTNWGPLPSQYSGLYGWTNNYRVVSNAKQITGTTFNITSACQLDVGLDLIPVFQFAIFYNNLLEFTWCAPFTVNGRTHADASIYTGSTCQLTFNGLVTTTGIITNAPWDGHSSSDYTVSTLYSTNGYSTNCQALTLPIGTTNVHAIIEMPPPGGDTNASLAASRYFNKADLVLLVSNSTVTLTLQNTSADAQPTNIVAYFTNSPVNVYPSNFVQVTTNFPFLTLTNTFTDQRENDKVIVTDIDMSKLDKWLLTNNAVNAKFPSVGGVYNMSNVPNILYAADNRSFNNGQLTAVRLKNGTTIPTNTISIAGSNAPSGFTVATPNPLYIDGNYNAPDSTTLYSTNTSKVYPASLASDALTILSQNWVDANSTQTLGNSGGGVHTATTTEVNAAILTGVVASTGSAASQFSGGVHNLPRLLEDWGNGGSTTLWLNTSIVNLFASKWATNQWQTPGVYYYAPTRQFSFNQNFLDYTKQPPGTPMLGYVLRTRWVVPPPNTINYSGN
jgi:hypothetical protein